MDIVLQLEETLSPLSFAVGQVAEEHRFLAKDKERVELIFDHNPDIDTILLLLASMNVSPLPHIEVYGITEQDWVTASLRDIQPLRLGRFLVHCSHHQVDVSGGVVPLLVDAGLAFGTGHHETTAGCLNVMSYLSKFYKPKKVLDIGTGTGILAIAASKLWHVPIVASDIDGIAVQVSKNNFKKNAVNPYIQAYQAPDVRNPAIQAFAPSDLVLANILARPLIGMAYELTQCVAKNGYLILSGLLWWQVRRVAHAYQLQNMRLEKSFKFGEWAVLLLKQK
jgi:ribosomal protein L11 methyltransferase